MKDPVELRLIVSRKVAERFRVIAAECGIGVNDAAERALFLWADNFGSVPELTAAEFVTPFENTCLDALPAVPAIYAVREPSGRIVYIGQTLSLLDRWRTHRLRADVLALGWRLTWKEPDERFLTLLAEETAWIALLQPPLNGGAKCLT